MKSEKLARVLTRTLLSMFLSTGCPSFHQDTLGLGSPVGGWHFKITTEFLGTLVSTDGEMIKFSSRTVKRLEEK